MKTKVHIPNEESVLKRIDKGYVPSYMIPKSYSWYDIGGKEPESGIEYTYVYDKNTANEFFENYIASNGNIDDESEVKSNDPYPWLLVR